MQCPHLIIKEQNKMCRKMLEDGLDGKVADFDVEHYCRGNLACCYYFRESIKLLKNHDRNTKNRTNNRLTTASQSV